MLYTSFKLLICHFIDSSQ